MRVEPLPELAEKYRRELRRDQLIAAAFGLAVAIGMFAAGVCVGYFMLGA